MSYYKGIHYLLSQRCHPWLNIRTTTRESVTVENVVMEWRVFFQLCQAQPELLISNTPRRFMQIASGLVVDESKGATAKIAIIHSSLQRPKQICSIHLQTQCRGARPGAVMVSSVAVAASIVSSGHPMTRLTKLAKVTTPASAQNIFWVATQMKANGRWTF